MYYGVILADIPGLIEGASGGKGLGIKFLRHIERTKTIFHLISADTEDPVHDYRVIRHELETYSKALLKKDETVFLTKSDSVSADMLKKKITALKKIKVHAHPLSIYNQEEVHELEKTLNEMKAKK